MSNNGTTVKVDNYMYFNAPKVVDQAIMSYFIGHTVLNILTTLYMFRMFRRDRLYLYRRALKKEKKPLMDHAFYVCLHLVANCLYLLGVSLELFDKSETKTVVNFLVTVACVFSVWSLLFFIQLIPSIGCYAVAMLLLCKE